MRGLVLSVLSTAAGYSFHGIPIKGPPIELTTELQVARWLRGVLSSEVPKNSRTQWPVQQLNTQPCPWPCT